MTQEPQKDSSNQQYQIYDSTFKEWVSQQADVILPTLLPGAVYEETISTELVLPTKRVDMAFRILYNGKEHLLDLEFETGYDSWLKPRLLVYNAVLYHKHHLPVITVVMYPFRTTVTKSPLRILSHEVPLLTFNFKTVPLFELDGAEIVRQRQACMYPLVPTMENVDADLMDQVMQELTELYCDDKETLCKQYVWIQILLERTGTIECVEKEKIIGRLSVFEQLFNESPMIQKIREQAREQGRQESIQNLQLLLVEAVQGKYPALAELARQQASRFNKPKTLNWMIVQVAIATDANTIRNMLEAVTEV